MRRQILISLILLTVFCVAPVFAQEKSANKEKLIAEFGKLKKTLFPYDLNNQCESYGKTDFFGERINLRFVNVKLSEILTIISEQYRCNFVIDKWAEEIPLTITADNVPWNVVLCSALQAQNLVAQVEGSVLHISESKNPEEINCVDHQSGLTKTLLATEFIKLNNLELKVVNYSDAANFDETANKFLEFVRKLASRDGAVEFDTRSQTLIITDERSRIKIISDFVKLLDESGFTLEEIVNEPKLEIK